ncbi:hypothetical protein HDU76_009411, partial [Blyttiomyces sp. JEL0837]
DGSECASGPNNLGPNGCPYKSTGATGCPCISGYFWDGTSCAQGTPNNNCGGGGGGNGGGGGSSPGSGWNPILIKGGQKALDFPTPNGPSPQGTQLQIWGPTGSGQQLYQFQPSPVGGNSFQIVNKLTGWCLDVSAFHTENKSPVALWPCNGARNQAFTLPAVQGGNWIRDVNSGKCLAVSTLGMNDGDKIFIWDCENNPNPQTIVWGINGNAPGPVPGPRPDPASASYGGIWKDPIDNANNQITKAIYGYDLANWGDDKQFTGTNLATCYSQLLNWEDGEIPILCSGVTAIFDSPTYSKFSMAKDGAALMTGYDMNGHFDAPGNPVKNVNNQQACESFCSSDPQCIGVTWGGNSCYKKYPVKSGDPNSVLTFNWDKLVPSCTNPRFFLSDPVWSGETITVYNPEWRSIILNALQGCDFNVGSADCKDIDVSSAFIQGNTADRNKLTVSLTGTGYDAPNCVDTTNLIGAMLMTNFNEAAKKTDETTSWDIQCDHCVKGTCARRRDEPFTYANITSIDQEVEQNNVESRDSHCGQVPPGCQCVKTTMKASWAVPTRGSVKIGTDDAGVQKNIQIELVYTPQCNTLLNDIFDFIFDVASWGLPLIKFDGKGKGDEALQGIVEKATTAVEAASKGSSFSSKFSQTTCGSKSRRTIEESIVTMPLSDSEIAQVGSHVCQYDKVDGTLQPGTSFLDVISFLTLTDVVSMRPQGCHCYNDGVTAICVNTIQQVNYFTSDDYANALDDVAVVNTLKSHCWQCNQTSFTLQAQTEHFQISVFPAKN